MSNPPSNLRDHLAIIVLHMTSTLTLLQLAYFFLLPEGKESDDECSSQKCSIADVTFFFKALHAYGTMFSFGLTEFRLWLKISLRVGWS